MRQRRDQARQHRLAARGWYALAIRSADDAVFVGGCGRSGTTLFREMLNRHPHIACGPETSMFGLPFNTHNQSTAWSIDDTALLELADRSENLVDYAEQFYRTYLLGPSGKPRWADKTPNNVRVIDKLLTWFPRGRFIHLVRDGRDVVCSLRHHPKETIVDGRLVPLNITNSIVKCATRWLRDTSRGLAFQEHPRCLLVRYEELVADPEGQMRRVCKFIGEDYDPVMLRGEVDSDQNVSMVPGRLVNNPRAVQPISSGSVGRWRRDLASKERLDFVNIAGELLISLGYAQSSAWVDEGSTPSERSDRAATRA